MPEMTNSNDYWIRAKASFKISWHAYQTSLDNLGRAIFALLCAVGLLLKEQFDEASDSLHRVGQTLVYHKNMISVHRRALGGRLFAFGGWGIALSQPVWFVALMNGSI